MEGVENAEISSQTLLPPIYWLSMNELKNVFHFLPEKDIFTAALLSKRLRSSQCAAAAIARLTINPCLPNCILTSVEAVRHIVFSSNIGNKVWEMLTKRANEGGFWNVRTLDLSSRKVVIGAEGAAALAPALQHFSLHWSLFSVSTLAHITPSSRSRFLLVRKTSGFPGVRFL
jgi:hypothetical protein